MGPCAIQKFCYKIAERDDIKMHFLTNKEIIDITKNCLDQNWGVPMALIRHKTNIILLVNSDYLIASDGFLKSCILHEVGHLKQRPRKNTMFSTEYKAQIWALTKAYQLKDQKLINEIEKDFYIWKAATKISTRYKICYDRVAKKGLLRYKLKGLKLIKNKYFNKKLVQNKLQKMCKR